jgi:antitoxin component YwqK of YwqJK toxin-antitoxin module
MAGTQNFIYLTTMIIKDTDPNLVQVKWDKEFNPVYQYKNELFTGIVQLRDAEGNTSEYGYKNGYIGGVYKAMYPGGQLKAEGTVVTSGFDGEYKEYFESGQLKELIIYKNDEIMSCTEYNENGVVKKVYQ